MAARSLFGLGAHGEIVKQIQLALTQAGFDPKGVDGWFGKNTEAALNAFQQTNSLAASKFVAEDCWQKLMQRPVPSVADRSLALTAAFEGHGFGLAVGNFYGALLTWGIIGFTLISGEIQKIVTSINQAFPQLVAQAFQDSTPELLDLVNASPEVQTKWANEHTLPNQMLVQPWRDMFALFGSFPEVQAEQMKLVVDDYLTPAIKAARMLGLTTELGLALIFDGQVQDGGIKAAAVDEVQSNLSANTSEETLRVAIANAVADNARPAFREDVRQRKLTIATGKGNVHGGDYVLDNWGLDGSFAAAELTD